MRSCTIFLDTNTSCVYFLHAKTRATSISYRNFTFLCLTSITHYMLQSTIQIGQKNSDLRNQDQKDSKFWNPHKLIIKIFRLFGLLGKSIMEGNRHTIDEGNILLTSTQKLQQWLRMCLVCSFTKENF